MAYVSKSNKSLYNLYKLLAEDDHLSEAMVRSYFVIISMPNRIRSSRILNSSSVFAKKCITFRNSMWRCLKNVTSDGFFSIFLTVVAAFNVLLVGAVVSDVVSLLSVTAGLEAVFDTESEATTSALVWKNDSFCINLCNCDDTGWLSSCVLSLDTISSFFSSLLCAPSFRSSAFLHSLGF